MKRILLYSLFMLLALIGRAQDVTIDKGTGILYFTGLPGTTPGIAYGSEFAIDGSDATAYIWNRDSSAWYPQIAISHSFAAPSGDPGTAPKLHINRTNGNLYQWSGSTWDQLGTGSSGGWNAAQPVLRVPSVGDTITGFDWWYFTPPTINMNSVTSIYEVGTSNSVTLSGSTTNDGGATLSNGTLSRTVPASATVTTFGASTTYSQGITFSPQQGGSGDYNELNYSFQATQDYSGTESGSISSQTRSIKGVYPIFYGMASTDTATVFANIYANIPNKLVQDEGDKTLSFTGTGLIYYCFPNTWADINLSSIIDPNGFNVTASFDRVPGHSLTSTGLTNNYTAEPCTCYVLNTGSTTTSSSNYTFNQ